MSQFNPMMKQKPSDCPNNTEGVREYFRDIVVAQEIVARKELKYQKSKAKYVIHGKGNEELITVTHAEFGIMNDMRKAVKKFGLKPMKEGVFLVAPPTPAFLDRLKKSRAAIKGRARQAAQPSTAAANSNGEFYLQLKATNSSMKPGCLLLYKDPKKNKCWLYISLGCRKNYSIVPALRISHAADNVMSLTPLKEPVKSCEDKQNGFPEKIVIRGEKKRAKAYVFRNQLEFENFHHEDFFEVAEMAKDLVEDSETVVDKLNQRASKKGKENFDKLKNEMEGSNEEWAIYFKEIFGNMEWTKMTKIKRDMFSPSPFPDWKPTTPKHFESIHTTEMGKIFGNTKPTTPEKMKKGLEKLGIYNKDNGVFKEYYMNLDNMPDEYLRKLKRQYALKLKIFALHLLSNMTEDLIDLTETQKGNAGNSSKELIHHTTSDESEDETDDESEDETGDESDGGVTGDESDGGVSLGSHSDDLLDKMKDKDKDYESDFQASSTEEEEEVVATQPGPKPDMKQTANDFFCSMRKNPPNDLCKVGIDSYVKKHFKKAYGREVTRSEQAEFMEFYTNLLMIEENEKTASQTATNYDELDKAVRQFLLPFFASGTQGIVTTKQLKKFANKVLGHKWSDTEKERCKSIFKDLYQNHEVVVAEKDDKVVVVEKDDNEPAGVDEEDPKHLPKCIPVDSESSHVTAAKHGKCESQEALQQHQNDEIARANVRRQNIVRGQNMTYEQLEAKISALQGSLVQIDKTEQDDEEELKKLNDRIREINKNKGKRKYVRETVEKDIEDLVNVKKRRMESAEKEKQTILAEIAELKKKDEELKKRLAAVVMRL